MIKLLLFYIFLSTIEWENWAYKLIGEEYAYAMNLLDNILFQLRRRNGPYYTLKEVEEATRHIPNLIYTFDTVMLMPHGNVFIESCLVELSIDLIKNNTLIVITCDGKEVARKLLLGTIDVE